MVKDEERQMTPAEEKALNEFQKRELEEAQKQARELQRRVRLLNLQVQTWGGRRKR